MIPKILFQTSRDAPDASVVHTIKSWLTPEWTYIHYTDADILRFFKQYPSSEFPNVTELFNGLTNGANKACFFRVYHMLVKGGVFLDSDAMLNAPIDEIVCDYSFFTVVSGAEPETVFNGFMGSTLGHPIVYEAVKYLYNTNPVVFNKNYFLSCYNIYRIIHSGNYENIKLYYEKPVQSNYVWGSFDDDKAVLYHYPCTKIIPQDYMRVYEWENKIRLGYTNDTGYVIADGLGSYDCYLSCGVGEDESFSRDFINKYAMNETNSFAFDGTIQQYPWEHTTNISFIRKNISDVCNEGHTDLSYYLERHNDVFLKMDIEGHEYRWIMHTPFIKNIKQMVFEFHGVWNDNNWNTGFSQMFKHACFRKLSETHVIVHAHGNNYGEIVNNMPNVIELTYVRRDVADQWKLNTKSLPLSNLDGPNNPNGGDIFLGFEPFTSISSEIVPVAKFPRVAIWIEDNWAFGRIARALKKYGHVDIYDWRDYNTTNQFWEQSWKCYDHIISTSVVFDRVLCDTVLKKLIVLVMHGEFGDPHFRETCKIEENVRYGGICKNVVEEMKTMGFPDPIWIPWGVDTDLFPVKYSVTGSIRKIGMIAAGEDGGHYATNKGYAMFQEICDAVGAEAVYIRGKPEEQIYDDIDLLICCSRIEGGPFGIFEASASGVPVMSTPVGNMKDINGLALFTTVEEALQQINAWNNDTICLREYTEAMTREITTNWSMKVCVDRFMSSFV
jgi:glycosyltransferase involved in cell wall biosynthesis